jgi:hypothetical protein
MSDTKENPAVVVTGTAKEPVIGSTTPRAIKSSKKPTKPLVLKNTLGKPVEEGDYFYSKEDNNGKAAPSFNEVCGMPVEREDLLGVFNKVFDPKDNILFYKTSDKEVYVIIVPLKFSGSVGEEHGSIDGDFQKHAISFLQEGSVNLDTLKAKLKRIVPFVKYTDR